MRTRIWATHRVTLKDATLKGGATKTSMRSYTWEVNGKANSISVLSMARHRTLMNELWRFAARISSITFDTPWRQPTKPPLGCLSFLGQLWN